MNAITPSQHVLQCLTVPVVVRPGLARASKTPGRTGQLNFFEATDRQRRTHKRIHQAKLLTQLVQVDAPKTPLSLVDLPGVFQIFF